MNKDAGNHQKIDFNNLPFTEFLREIFGGQVHKVVTQLFTMKIEIFLFSHE